LTKLEILHANNNLDITNVNHMTKLKTLSASYFCEINNDGISNIADLEISYANTNTKITNVNHVTKLKELQAGGSLCGINNKGIINLTKLEILYANYNTKITDVNHMTKLKTLLTSYDCGINDDGISNIANFL